MISCAPPKPQKPILAAEIRKISIGFTAHPDSSPYSQVVDPLQDRAALAADQGVAIAADQRVGDGFGAGRTVEIGEWDGIGHAVRIISLP